jgi:hypothetical protein
MSTITIPRHGEGEPLGADYRLSRQPNRKEGEHGKPGSPHAHPLRADRTANETAGTYHEDRWWCS